MIIRVFVPTLGEVNVMTSPEDSFRVICDLLPDGSIIYNLNSETILQLICGDTTRSTMIAYIADLGNIIDIGFLMTRLLRYNIETSHAAIRYNVIIPNNPYYSANMNYLCIYD